MTSPHRCKWIVEQPGIAAPSCVAMEESSERPTDTIKACRDNSVLNGCCPRRRVRGSMDLPAHSTPQRLPSLTVGVEMEVQEFFLGEKKQNSTVIDEHVSATHASQLASRIPLHTTALGPNSGNYPLLSFTVENTNGAGGGRAIVELVTAPIPLRLEDLARQRRALAVTLAATASVAQSCGEHPFLGKVERSGEYSWIPLGEVARVVNDSMPADLQEYNLVTPPHSPRYYLRCWNPGMTIRETVNTQVNSLMSLRAFGEPAMTSGLLGMMGGLNMMGTLLSPGLSEAFGDFHDVESLSEYFLRSHVVPHVHADAVLHLSAVFKLLLWATLCNAQSRIAAMYGFPATTYQIKMMMPLMPKTSVQAIVAALPPEVYGELVSFMARMKEEAAGAGVKPPLLLARKLYPYVFSSGRDARALGLRYFSLLSRRSRLVGQHVANAGLSDETWRPLVSEDDCRTFARRDFEDLFCAHLEQYVEMAFSNLSALEWMHIDRTLDLDPLTFHWDPRTSRQGLHLRNNREFEFFKALARQSPNWILSPIEAAAAPVPALPLFRVGDTLMFVGEHRYPEMPMVRRLSLRPEEFSNLATTIRQTRDAIPPVEVAQQLQAVIKGLTRFSPFLEEKEAADMHSGLQRAVARPHSPEIAQAASYLTGWLPGRPTSPSSPSSSGSLTP